MCNITTPVLNTIFRSKNEKCGIFRLSPITEVDVKIPNQKRKHYHKRIDITFDPQDLHERNYEILNLFEEASYQWKRDNKVIFLRYHPFLHAFDLIPVYINATDEIKHWVELLCTRPYSYTIVLLNGGENELIRSLFNKYGNGTAGLSLTLETHGPAFHPGSFTEDTKGHDYTYEMFRFILGTNDVPMFNTDIVVNELDMLSIPYACYLPSWDGTYRILENVSMLEPTDKVLFTSANAHVVFNRIFNQFTGPKAPDTFVIQPTNIYANTTLRADDKSSSYMVSMRYKLNNPSDMDTARTDMAMLIRDALYEMKLQRSEHLEHLFVTDHMYLKVDKNKPGITITNELLENGDTKFFQLNDASYAQDDILSLTNINKFLKWLHREDNDFTVEINAVSSDRNVFDITDIVVKGPENKADRYDHDVLATIASML